jgi:hypothetical protein
MSEEVFQAAIELICKLRKAGLERWWPSPEYLHNPCSSNTEPHRACIANICGGEPTVHPQFWDFVNMAYTKLSQGVSVITNGKRTEDALQLALLAEEKLLDVWLSLDKYHEPISPEVVKAFHRNPVGFKGVTNVGDFFFSSGRAIERGIGTPGICLCPDLYINVDGTRYACGCKSESFGTVFDPRIPYRFLITRYYCSNNLPHPTSRGDLAHEHALHVGDIKCI